MYATGSAPAVFASASSSAIESRSFQRASRVLTCAPTRHARSRCGPGIWVLLRLGIVWLQCHMSS